MAVLRPVTRLGFTFLALNLVSGCLTSSQPHKPAEVVYLGGQHYGRGASSYSSAPASQLAAGYSNIQTSRMDSAPAQQAAPVESVATGDLTAAPVTSRSLDAPVLNAGGHTTSSTIAVNDTPATSKETIVQTLNQPATAKPTGGTLQLPKDYSADKVYTAPRAETMTADLNTPPLGAKKEKEKEQAKAPAPAKASMETAAPVKAIEQAAPLPAKAEEPKAAAPAPKAVAVAPFIWPAQGKIITSYGANVNGSANDGINIALPEGTRVKSAADGTVVYAGNDLKAYGNLLIIRHQDGWISSYAHTGKIMVNKGDTVKQGQVVALSGASGEVSQPQLHFGIRKGKEPVDPISVLQEGTAELNQLQPSSKTPG